MTSYEKPTLVELGTVAELTEQLTDKTFGPTDGFTFNGSPIKDAS